MRKAVGLCHHGMTSAHTGPSFPCGIAFNYSMYKIQAAKPQAWTQYIITKASGPTAMWALNKGFNYRRLYNAATALSTINCHLSTIYSIFLATISPSLNAVTLPPSIINFKGSLVSKTKNSVLVVKCAVMGASPGGKSTSLFC